MSKSDAYLANPRLKRAYVNLEFTEDQVKEIARCTESMEYFLTHHYNIRVLNRGDGKPGEIPFAPYTYQARMASLIEDNRFTIFKLPRQSGKSILVIGILLWYLLFTDDMTIGILANKAASAKKLIKALKYAYERIPKWMQQGVLAWGVTHIELENGSEIMALATASDAARSHSFNVVYLDELAFVPQNVAEEFFAAVYPTISAADNTRMIITSTPNGFNFFYKLWDETEKKDNSFVPMSIHYSEKPGRDAAWAERERRNIGEEKFNQEYMCEFTGAKDSLISSNKKLIRHKAIYEEDGLAVYKEPEQGHKYVLVADTSEGIGQDYSAFSVIDITSKPFIQAARFYDNKTGVDVYPYIIKSTAEKYNRAHVFCELNDIGDQVAKTIWWELEYENVIMTRPNKPFGQELTFMATKGSKPGVKTSTGVKRVGCSNLKHLIEDDVLEVRDWNTIQELTNFVKIGTTFQAKEGHHDDLVMGLVLFGWLVKQPGFEFLTSQEVKPTEKKVDFVIPKKFGTMAQLHQGSSGITTSFGDNDVWHLVDKMPLPRRY